MEPNNVGGFLSKFGQGLGRTIMGIGSLGLSEVAYANAADQQRRIDQAAQQKAMQQQELAKIIAAPMTPDQKLQALAALGTADAVEYARELAKPAETPASIREFQAIEAMPEEQRKRFEAQRNAMTPYQQEQLRLERMKLENSPEFQQQQRRQQAQQLEQQARQLEAAGRRQEAQAVRSEAQQVAAQDPRKLSATEQKEFYEAEEKATAAGGVQSALDAALQLNDKAFSGVTADTRAWLNRVPGIGALIPDEGAMATTDLNNIILSQALESLKVTFGAAPTEGERKILIDLQASVDKLPAERKAILERAKAAAARREKSSRAKMQGIVTGGIYGGAALPMAEDSPLGGLTLPDAGAIEAELRRRGVM